jgi:endonuclease III
LSNEKTFPVAMVVKALRSYLGDDVPVVTRLSRRQNADPFIILVGTILSLRTRDEQTDLAMDRLKPFIKGPADILQLPVATLERLIYPVGFYRVKAETLKEIARILIDKYAGQVPSSLEELLSLRGVGRKTANLVLAEGFGKPAICVDTHVHRISNRLGLVTTGHPHQTEDELRRILPRKHWIIWNTLLVAFGRKVCTPLSPRCSICPIVTLCARSGVGRHR